MRGRGGDEEKTKISSHLPCPRVDDISAENKANASRGLRCAASAEARRWTAAATGEDNDDNDDVDGARSRSPSTVTSTFFYSAASPSAAPSTLGAQSNTPASRTWAFLPPERRLEATSSRSEASEAEEDDD